MVDFLYSIVYNDDDHHCWCVKGNVVVIAWLHMKSIFYVSGKTGYIFPKFCINKKTIEERQRIW